MEVCREFENYFAASNNDDKNSANDETTEEPVEDNNHGELKRFEKTVKEEPPDEPN